MKSRNFLLRTTDYLIKKDCDQIIRIKGQEVSYRYYGDNDNWFKLAFPVIPGRKPLSIKEIKEGYLFDGWKIVTELQAKEFEINSLKKDKEPYEPVLTSFFNNAEKEFIHHLKPASYAEKVNKLTSINKTKSSDVVRILSSSYNNMKYSPTFENDWDSFVTISENETTE